MHKIKNVLLGVKQPNQITFFKEFNKIFEKSYVLKCYFKYCIHKGINW